MKTRVDKTLIEIARKPSYLPETFLIDRWQLKKWIKISEYEN